jgi:CRISPR-associated endoribonuclease Cas6
MKIAAFEFQLRPKKVLSLPVFKGSTFRGTFGRALKRSICVIRNKECEDCILYANCAYPYIFDTTDENGHPVLRPFVLQIPEYENEYTSDQIFSLGIVLFGKAIHYLPYFIVSFQNIGERGIGKYKSKFELEKVINTAPFHNSREIYTNETRLLKKDFISFTLDHVERKSIHSITLEFLTPVQLRKNNRPTSEIDFHLFYTSLVRRYKRLQWAHSEENTELPSYSSEELEKIRTSATDLKFNRFRRYSNRQRQEMYLMGVTGKITFEGDLTSYYPMLKIGEYIHVGKNAAFGLGQYKIVEEL